MAGCGSPLSALDCGRHCFCGVWDAVAGSQAGPRGGAPRSVPCVAGYRTGTCRATLLDPRGPSEGRLRGSLDRACGFHTPPAWKRGPRQTQGGDRQGRAGPAHAEDAHKARSEDPRPGSWPSVSRDAGSMAGDGEEADPKATASSEMGPLLPPEHFAGGGMSTGAMGVDRRPSLDWQLLLPIPERRGPPNPARMQPASGSPPGPNSRTDAQSPREGDTAPPQDRGSSWASRRRNQNYLW